MGVGNLMIVQGGGPTAVFNASLSSAISEAVSQPGVGRVFGARYGMRGLVEGDIVELGQMAASELELLRNSPGAALGSSRYKPTEDDYDRMVGSLRRLDIRLMIFMGGNGTMRGAALVSEHCHDAGFSVQVIGVPKTVDNDIAMTDRCPGFASAARYMAQTTRDLGMDIRSLPQPVTILEVIGRSIGWLAAATALAKSREADAPHLIYLPERPFHAEKFLADLDEIVTRHGWAIVVATEGIRNPDGSLVYELTDPTQLDPLARPMTGGVGQFMANLVGENLKIRCRSEKPGLIARAARAHVSAQDQKDAELVGRAGVRAMAAGETEKMVSLLPIGTESGYELVPLSEVADAERPVPAEWILDAAIPVGDRFINYVKPLVGELTPYFVRYTN
ncbi:MAG: diphosphate--fructose-6-phosphate 1-phosphotransferase [Terracidiphilus sp.]|jgi:6-phosphofructokinase 1